MLENEDFDSDTSDDDYVPTEAKDSDEGPSSGAEEGDSDLNEPVEDGQAKPLKKVKTKKLTKKSRSNRKVNPLLSQLQETVQHSEIKNFDEEIKLENEKKKDEDIWADFLADTDEKKEPVTTKPKKKSWSELLGKKKPKPAASPTSTEEHTSSSSTVVPAASKKIESKAPATVKITKLFDFAGEEVRVEEEVAADSKEAKAAAAAEALSSSQSAGGASTKRSSNIAGLLSTLGGKKQKLSTLDKTKLDWQSYKAQEGLIDELQLHSKSKDTYLDKQDFLQRADVRQFEIERDIRQGSRRSHR